MKKKDTTYPKVWESGGIWHWKKSKRAMTGLYRSKELLLAWHPELTEAVGGTMFFAHVDKP